MRNLVIIGVFALPMLVGFGSPSIAATPSRSYIPPARQSIEYVSRVRYLGRTHGAN